MTEAKPLHPMTHGSILVVGAKASNFDKEILENPRVILWDSQDQKWEGREVPQNTQAIFITRFIGHKNFDNIMRDARKRRITIFNPQGTGMITKQVKELLGMNGTVEHVVVAKETQTTPMTTPDYSKNKLLPLKALADFSKGNKENADFLIVKAKELGIQTSERSLAQMVYHWRKAAGEPSLRGKSTVTRTVITKQLPKYQKQDVVVEIFDNLIREMSDIRAYLVQTVEENQTLKARIEKFKKSLTED